MVYPKSIGERIKILYLGLGGVIPKCLMSKTGLDAQF